MTLTGKTRYRTSWRGKLILQVQVNGFVFCNYGDQLEEQSWWKDATFEDLQSLKEYKV